MFYEIIILSKYLLVTMFGNALINLDYVSKILVFMVFLQMRWLLLIMIIIISWYLFFSKCFIKMNKNNIIINYSNLILYLKL